MYEMYANALVEYTPRAQTTEFPTAIARGGTEFSGASVHRYIFIGHIYPLARKAKSLFFLQ